MVREPLFVKTTFQVDEFWVEDDCQNDSSVAERETEQSDEVELEFPEDEVVLVLEVELFDESEEEELLFESEEMVELLNKIVALFGQERMRLISPEPTSPLEVVQSNHALAPKRTSLPLAPNPIWKGGAPGWGVRVREIPAPEITLGDPKV